MLQAVGLQLVAPMSMNQRDFIKISLLMSETEPSLLLSRHGDMEVTI